MPSPDKTLRIVVIGDSQMGSLKIAHDRGLVHWPVGSHVEFWGATGARFREIDWIDGKIQASGSAGTMVKKINGNGRDHILPDDFDCFLFYGARLRAWEFFAKILEWAEAQAALPSRKVIVEAACGFLICARAYRIARELVAMGRRVVFVPAPFFTEGIDQLKEDRGFLDTYPFAAEVSDDVRCLLSDALQEAASRDGVTLVRQPEDTVSQGLLTCREFALRGAEKKNDPGHKSAEFAARWMQDVVPLLARHAEAA